VPSRPKPFVTRQFLRRPGAKVNPTRALDALCPAERGDPDRCEFRSFLPAGGCIDRLQEELVLTRRGVPSKKTPLRVGVERNLPRVDSMKEASIWKIGSPGSGITA